ncbi:MAG TPA: T9SS type A sorting domain-containing protein, partial [Saprospiraceae bacterium]|nr:T9SS type A sorting domain-containing protein [Saprospiraceae bacterium]
GDVAGIAQVVPGPAWNSNTSFDYHFNVRRNSLRILGFNVMNDLDLVAGEVLFTIVSRSASSFSLNQDDEMLPEFVFEKLSSYRSNVRIHYLQSEPPSDQLHSFLAQDGTLKFVASSPIKSIELYSLAGAKWPVQTSQKNEKEVFVNVSAIPAGFYFARVSLDSGKPLVCKWVKS